MNLRAIANAYTRGINPNTTDATLMTNVGYTYSDSGKQIPSYNSYPDIEIQVQSLESKDLEFLASIMTQQGQYTFVYANNLVSAQRRTLDKGSDLMIFKPYREDEFVAWRVVKVVESYPDWVKVLVVRLSAEEAAKYGYTT